MSSLFTILSSLSATDRWWVEKALSSFPSANSGDTFESISTDVEAGKAQAWRFSSGEDNGGAVTQIFKEDGELFIWLLAGTGLGKHGERIIANLTTFARSLGLSKISAVCTLRMAEWLEKHEDFRRESVLMTKEV